MNKDFLISVLDMLVIMIIILLLAAFAVTADQNKGLGDLDYIGLLKLNASDNIQGDTRSFDFYAIILTTKNISIAHYFEGNLLNKTTFNSLSSFSKSTKLYLNRTYVIYEDSESPFFASIIRKFSLEGVPIGIAVTAK